MFVCLYIDTASKTSHLLVVDLIAFTCTYAEFILGVSGNVMISYSRVFALFSPCVQSLDIIRYYCIFKDISPYRTRRPLIGTKYERLFFKI